ncbi:MAG: DUF1501 domain-containing protein, partial [Acidobacteria bacterium]|nr:DUF1501 domain-containing protein [Acidobacteriota bacterium]
MLIKSRRDFLKIGLQSVSGLGALGAMSHFGRMNAMAAGSNYKALVCIFLAGGNDGHNTVVPITTGKQTYSQYQLARQSLAIPAAQLLQVSTKGGDIYGLHPKLKEIQTLYQQGHAAILANVGMLAQAMPNGKGDLATAKLPANLYSHSDQTGQWQSSVATGLAPTGWGGRMADILQPVYNPGASFPTVVSTGGLSLFCTGAQSTPTAIPPAGASQLNVFGQAGSSRLLGAQQLLTFDNGLKLVQASNTIVTNGHAAGAKLNSLVTSGPQLPVTFPASPTANQLRTVAQIINVSTQLGLGRQIFFVTLGGFDTHTTQASVQDSLFSELSPALSAFYDCTVKMGLDQQVTTFSSSEFGRTLMPNTAGGTDHAWGSHHFILGGAVQGGDLYGSFPSLVLGGNDDANSRGAMIPGTAVDQYSATLAQWFGVQGAQNLSIVVPNIGAF